MTFLVAEMKDDVSGKWASTCFKSGFNKSHNSLQREVEAVSVAETIGLPHKIGLWSLGRQYILLAMGSLQWTALKISLYCGYLLERADNDKLYLFCVVIGSTCFISFHEFNSKYY